MRLPLVGAEVRFVEEQGEKGPRASTVHHRKAFPVAYDGVLIGLIETRALAEEDRWDWDRLTVGELMRRDLEAITIRPKADALEALGKMERSGSRRLLVTDGGQLVGIVSLNDLLRFLSLTIELGGLDEKLPPSAPDRPVADEKIADQSLVTANQ